MKTRNPSLGRRAAEALFARKPKPDSDDLRDEDLADVFLDVDLLPGDVRIGDAQGDPTASKTGRDMLATAWGVVWVAPVDRLFYSVRLPRGWWIKALMNSSFWFSLIDAQGNVRGEIFDRTCVGETEAWLVPLPRYHVEVVFSDDATEAVRYLVRDRELRRVLHQTAWVQAEALGVRMTAENAARIWMRDRFPKYADPLAYWSPTASAPAADPA